jgi:hypothetical protein
VSVAAVNPKQGIPQHITDCHLELLEFIHVKLIRMTRCVNVEYVPSRASRLKGCGNDMPDVVRTVISALDMAMEATVDAWKYQWWQSKQQSKQQSK